MAINSVNSGAPVKPVTPLAPNAPAAKAATTPESTGGAEPKPVTNTMGQPLGQLLNTKA
nr:hypothetical protein [uncultured Rhodoferax sp.]